MSRRTVLPWIVCVMACGGLLRGQADLPAQTASVRGRVEVAGRERGRKRAEGVPETVVWLIPVGATAGDAASAAQAATREQPLRLIQKNKKFEPHVLVVPAGSTVEFPNRDPLFHNVFSLFEGKRFDLGLYEAGSTRTVRFDRVGVSYIFCNIHSDMSAVVITLNTPYSAVSDGKGQLALPSVPYGRYRVHVWSEGMTPDEKPPAPREITISAESPSLGVVRVPASAGQRIAHKNKYGRDYDAAAPDSPVYDQQH